MEGGGAELSNEYPDHKTYIDVICFCDVGCTSNGWHQTRVGGGGGYVTLNVFSYSLYKPLITLGAYCDCPTRYCSNFITLCSYAV